MESLDYGAMTSQKGITKGYLPQDGCRSPAVTIFASAYVFADLHDMEKELETLHKVGELDPQGPETRPAADVCITSIRNSGIETVRDRGAGRHGGSTTGFKKED